MTEARFGNFVVPVLSVFVLKRRMGDSDFAKPMGQPLRDFARFADR